MVVSLGDTRAEERLHSVLTKIPRLLFSIIVVEANDTSESRAESTNGSRDISGKSNLVEVESKICFIQTLIDNSVQGRSISGSNAIRPVVEGVSAGAHGVTSSREDINSRVDCDGEVVPVKRVNSVVNLVSDILRISPGDSLIPVIVVGKISREAVGEELFAGVNLVHIDTLGNDDGVGSRVGDTGNVNFASDLAIRSPTSDGTVHSIIRRSSGIRRIGVAIVHGESVSPAFVRGVSPQLSSNTTLAR